MRSVRIGSIILHLLVITSLFSFPGRSIAETSNRVVAQVNNEVITLYELNNKIEEMTGQKSEDIKAQDEDMYLKTRRDILELMINEKIAQEKVEELGIQVTQSQVDTAIENIKKTNLWTQEDLLEQLKAQGISYEKYRETIKYQLERVQLINYEVKSKILIREEQLIQYYQDHLASYKIEPEVRIAGIFLGGESAKERGKDLLKRIMNGEDFGKLAKEFSQGPGAEEGGDLGRFKMRQIDPDMRKVLEGLGEGEVSGLIKRDNGICIIKLIEKKEGRVRPFEEVRDGIYENLYNEEVNKRYASWIKDLREKTFTRIIF